jgi:hypothetical protein
MLGFIGPDNPSSLVTTLLNRHSLPRGGLQRENETAQDDGQDG